MLTCFATLLFLLLMGLVSLFLLMLVFIPFSIYALKKHKLRPHVFITLVTFLIVAGTAIFIPTTVYTTEQERRIEFGFPYTFLIQNSSYDIVAVLGAPASIRLGSAREDVTSFLWDGFLKSFAVFFVIFEFLYFLLKRKPAQ